MPVTPYNTNTAEQQKQILALLRTGPAYVMFDNATGQIDSADLAAMITESRYQGRLLGATQIIQCEVVGSVIFNGVNVNFSAELTRRMLPIRMASRHHAPELREGPWKYPNFTGYLMENRPRLVWAAHVLIAWWLQQGGHARRPGGPVMGSFEAWSDVLGGILEAAEVPGFLGNLDAYKGRNAEGRGDERAAVEMLAKWFPARNFDAADVMMSMQSVTGAPLPGLPELDPRANAELANKRLIGDHIQGLTRFWQLNDEHAIRKVLGIPSGPVPETLRVEVVRVRKKNPAAWKIKVAATINDATPTVQSRNLTLHLSIEVSEINGLPV